MAKAYEVTTRVRIINTVVAFLNRFGLAGSGTRTLTTLGRKSGQERSTPVTLATVDGARYLVSPYGQVGWVHNLRAANQATLAHRGAEEEIEVDEVSGTEAGAVLKHYVGAVKIVRPYFDASPDDSVEDFVAELSSHPVFRIR